MEYYDTYFFVSLIHDLAEDDTESYGYHDVFEEFVKRHTKIIFQPFQKFSVLHQFISFVAYKTFIEEIDDTVLDLIVTDNSYILWVNNALTKYKIPHIDFTEWLTLRSLSIKSLEHERVILDYVAYLYETGPLRDLLGIISNEVFYILFLNRHFLYQFNKRINQRTKSIKNIDITPDIMQFFKNDGVLRRVTIPMWARKAVFFRDRGICSNCLRDISGLTNIQNTKHFDHIIPLACGGLNDVSNLQLLCDTCNLQKNRHEIRASTIYEKWY